jgi:hypothetical protein
MPLVETCIHKVLDDVPKDEAVDEDLSGAQDALIFGAQDPVDVRLSPLANLPLPVVVANVRDEVLSEQNEADVLVF